MSAYKVSICVGDRAFGLSSGFLKCLEDRVHEQCLFSDSTNSLSYDYYPQHRLLSSFEKMDLFKGET